MNRVISRPTLPVKPAIIVMAALALIGVVVVIVATAAGPFSATEAENATLSGGASAQNDSTASGGKYLQFAGAAGDPVIVTAGDIACDPASANFNGGNGGSSSCRDKYTSDLIAANPNIAAVLPLGDNQYQCGGLTAYQQSYNLSWGRFKAKTRPVIGNHEYLADGLGSTGQPSTGCDATGQGKGYFDYFGSLAGTRGQGYYSYNIGAWHLIALNSDCSQAGGCGSGSPQYNWLKADLASSTATCTLAYFHHPLISQDTSGGKASNVGAPFWDLLYTAGGDVILNGHSHNYQRYAPMTPSKTVDNARGIVEFVAGTGGANHTSIDTAITPKPVVANATSFGILQLTLHADSYGWKFIPEAAGGFTDSGSAGCH